MFHALQSEHCPELMEWGREGAPKSSWIPSKEFIEFHWLQLNVKSRSLPGYAQPIWHPCFDLTEGSWRVLFF